MTIKAIIWDFGGVIMRTEDGSHRDQLAIEYKTSRSQLEYEVFASPAGVQAQLGKVHPDELWEYVGQRFEMTPDKLLRFQDRFWAGDELDEALVETIRHLQASYKTALLSNAWLDLRGHLENTWKIIDAFDKLIISAELGMAKPDPRIYQKAVEAVGVEPQEAVFIDDFEHNIEGARNAGIHGIHFRSAEQALKELGELLENDTGDSQSED